MLANSHNMKTRNKSRVLRIILVILPEHQSDTKVLTMTMEILLEPTSNKLCGSDEVLKLKNFKKFLLLCIKHWKNGFFLIDWRAIPDSMAWKHPSATIDDPWPAAGSFNMADVRRLSAHVIKLRDMPKGVLVLFGLSRFWKSRVCDPVLRGADRNVMVMSDSEDSTVTYTAVSSPFGGLSNIGSPGAPPSPNYVPGPEYPPLPDFVPEPVYPEFMPPEDEVLLAEEQPLPAAASPTTDSSGYVPVSDPEEDPKEDDDEDPEEDPVDYPADGGDDGDDEDESSNDNEDEDVNIEGDEEEEEHPAPADSTTVVLSAVDHAPSAEETEPFETDESAAIPPPHPAYRVTIRISIRDEPPTPLWSDTEIARLLAIPTSPPSPLSLWSSLLPQIPLPPLPVSSPVPVISSSPPASLIRPLGYRAAMIRLRAKAPSTSHSPPPHIILSHTRAVTPPSGTPLLLPYRYLLHHHLCIYSLLTVEQTDPRLPYRLRRGYVSLSVRDMREIMRDLERDVSYGITDTWDEMPVDMPGAPANDDTYTAGNDYRVIGSGLQETCGDYRDADSGPHEADTVH
ncbi:hypothetical protein Tco_1380643 [Tanacetum coccineum]